MANLVEIDRATLGVLVTAAAEATEARAEQIARRDPKRLPYRKSDREMYSSFEAALAVGRLSLASLGAAPGEGDPMLRQGVELADDVARCWEHGNLAQAVRNLKSWALAVKRAAAERRAEAET